CALQAAGVDSLLFVFLLQVDQRLAVAVGDRALERKEDEDDRLLVLEFVESETLVLFALQDEVGDFRAELGARRIVRPGGRGEHNETQKGRENSPHELPLEKEPCRRMDFALLHPPYKFYRTSRGRVSLSRKTHASPHLAHDDNEDQSDDTDRHAGEDE